MSHSQRKRRWRRRGLVALAGVVVVGSGVAVAFCGSSPIGHWKSADGRERYMGAYAEAMADLPDPRATLDVRTDYGIVRAYRFEGSADGEFPLVLLPGRASASPVWADNVPSLLELGDVYAIDLLGEPGMSVQDRPIEDDEDQARWLDQALRGLPEERFHLVGLSIGGWTAANLALRRPEAVASLILIEAVFVFDDIPLGTVIRSIPASLPWLPKAWRDRFNSWTAGGAPVEDVPVADMIEAGMQHYALRLPQPARISESELARLRMPVLAILAGQSVMHDADTAVETARRVLSDGTVRLYPDASHAVTGEYSAEVAADIRRFLEGR